MSDVFNFQVSKDTSLSKMDEAEIRKMVVKEADRFLEALPSKVSVADVNAVQLRSNPAESLETGFWAQWTRACCDRRNRIADFIYPEIDVLRGGLTEEVEEKFEQNHFDSNFAIRAVARALK